MKKYKNYVYILFCLVFVIINVILININYNIDRSNIVKLNIIFLLFEVGLCVILNILIKNSKKVENIFLIIALFIGFLFLILIPVGQAPDEHNHLIRIYEISEGRLISSKNDIHMPCELTDVIVNESNNNNYSFIISNLFKNNSNENKNYTFTNASLYNFVCYIPQVIGMLIGKIFNAPILLDAYLSRLFNFIFWIILIYNSIKYIPFGKEIIIFISLLPITLQEAISLSPDSLTYSSTIFLISYSLFLAYKKEKLKKIDYVIISIICIIVSLCKIVYLPVCLILFIIPKEKFKSLKDKYFKILILAVIVIMLNIIWLNVASDFLVSTQEGVVPKLQEKYILSKPFNYIKVILKSCINKFSFYLYSMLGEYLQTLNVNVTKVYPTLSILCLLFFIISQRKNIKDTEKYDLKKNEYAIFIFIIFSVVFLIFTGLYIQWTSLENDVIEGVQGRYFLPILPLFLLLFLKKEETIYDERYFRIIRYACTFSIFFNICALSFIFLANGC